MNTQALRRFAKYSIVGVGTFALDLLMLYGAVQYAGMAYYVATPGAFLIAVTINYVLSRLHVFRETARSWHGGYLYFALVAISAAVATTASVALLVSTLHLNYLIARTLTAGMVGICGYLINLHFNFRVAGTHVQGE